MNTPEEKTTISQAESIESSWTPEEERKIVRKIDICLLPMLWLMNLLSWMDRAKRVPSSPSYLPR